MQQNVPDFTALLRSAKRSAVHLEMRDSYMDDPVFAAWREGGCPAGGGGPAGAVGAGPLLAAGQQPF